jgi:DNA polymerase III delta prime subunit
MSLVSKQYDDFIWELKYRPDTLDAIILPPSIFAQMESIKKKGKLPNMLFSGSAGTGKTTTAFVLADDMKLSAMYLNMSLESSIDTIRTKLIGFAQSVSISGAQKVFIGDEFDRLSPSAMDSLKGVIEKMSSNCKFIFTSNHKGKIIDPILSRLQEVDFVFSKEDASIMKKRMWKVACQICQKEEVEFESRAIADVVKELFPDMRKILNHLQMLSLRGPITTGAVDSAIATDTEGFFKLLRDDDWTGTRQYIVDLPIAINDFYSVLYGVIERYVAQENVSEAIVMIAKYQYEASFAVDKQIPLAALAIEMMNLDYRKDF